MIDGSFFSTKHAEIHVYLGSTSVKQITNHPKIKVCEFRIQANVFIIIILRVQIKNGSFQFSDFVLYLSGHITMWLDLSLLGSAADAIIYLFFLFIRFASNM